MAWWNNKKYYRLALVMLLLAGGMYFLYLVRGVFLSLLLAVILTYLLNPLLSIMEKKGVPRVLSILLTYIALVIMAGGLVFYGMPHFIEQLDQLAELVPVYTEQVKEIVETVQRQYARAEIPDEIRDVIEERIFWIEQSLLELAQRVAGSLTRIAGYIFNIILAPVLAFYLLKDIEVFRKKAVQAIPRRWRDDMLALGAEIDTVINKFIRAYATVSLIVGGLTWLAMSALRVEFPIMLGVFAGLTQIIPYFGPFIGALPAVTLALLTSKWLALKVGLAFFVIQQLEGSVISPKILGSHTGLHPLFVILVLLAGGQLFGLAGMILAVPVAAILRVIFVFVYQRFVC